MRPAKAGMFSRSQSYQGKSQSPVVRIAEETETEPLKPIDKISLREITSHRAIERERVVASKGLNPKAEPANPGRRQEQPKSDRHGCSLSAG